MNRRRTFIVEMSLNRYVVRLMFLFLPLSFHSYQQNTEKEN